MLPLENRRVTARERETGFEGGSEEPSVSVLVVWDASRAENAAIYGK